MPARFIHTPEGHRRALADLAKVSPPYRIEISRGKKRSNDQNALLWAMLAAVSKQATHQGLRLSSEDWKVLFMHALNLETRAVPNLDGNGFVTLGVSTSKLTKAQFADLITLIEAYAAREGIDLEYRKDAA